MNIYDFTVKAQDGSDVALSDYKGKVVLIVNTATACGFTPQYKELQEIYNADHEKGLEILDFPCNQFGEQAPGSDDEIHTFCTGRFGITFPQFSKIDVNGENADPLYKYLTTNTRFGGFSGPAKLMMNGIAKKMDPDFKNNGIDTGATIRISRDSSVTNTDNKKPLSALKASIPYSSYTYNAGKAIKPTVTVKNGTSKIAASNYTVTYSNNTKVGVATIIIEGKGSYRGFLKKTFVIKPKPQTLTLTTTSGAFKAAWTKDTTAIGYQIKYSKDKSFKTGVTTYTVSNNTKTSVNFSSKPKSGETWYVKYRAYYEVNGSKYGNYSSVKSVKVK